VPIRVVVAEDSVTTRELIVAVLTSDPDIAVVGQAANGTEAVALASRLRPDVITMDIRMPVMDGFEATRRIMSEAPTRIIVLSSSVDAEELKITFEALKLGAVAVVEKPRASDAGAFQAVRQQFLDTVKSMAEVRVVRHWPKHPPAPRLRTVVRPPASPIQVIAVAASTGGPGALAALLQALPPDLGAPILAVQHITPGFERGLAGWLGSLTSMRVRLATDGARLTGGEVLVGPSDYHMGVAANGTVSLDRRPPIQGHRPSATALFASVAAAFGPRAIGVVLTGMGEDGAAGLKALRDAGGRTIAQDEASCVVYGMPRAAVALGAVEYVEPLDHIAERILHLMGGTEGRGPHRGPGDGRPAPS
jgi:two-component system chemotaxis response regulator CheB